MHFRNNSIVVKFCKYFLYKFTVLLYSPKHRVDFESKVDLSTSKMAIVNWCLVRSCRQLDLRSTCKLVRRNLGLPRIDESMCDLTPCRKMEVITFYDLLSISNGSLLCSTGGVYDTDKHHLCPPCGRMKPLNYPSVLTHVLVDNLANTKLCKKPEK